MTENPLAHIRTSMDGFTKGERHIAEYLLDNPDCIFKTNSITDLAQAMGSSNTSLIRFCQKLGYQGFGEFRFALRRELLQRGIDGQEEGDQEPEGAVPSKETQRLIDVYKRYFDLIPQMVPEERVDALAEAIMDARRICIWGANRTGLSAQQLSLRLLRLGIMNKVATDQIAMADDASIVGAGDLCIAFTMAGRGADYLSLVRDARSGGAQVALVSMNSALECVKEADIAVVLPWISHENKANFFEDQLVVYMFIEVLLLRLSHLAA